MKDARNDPPQQVPAHPNPEFGAIVSAIASRGVEVIVLDDSCRPLAITPGAAFELQRQDALRLVDGRVVVLDRRQQGAFGRYVGLSTQYSVDCRPSLICLALARTGSGGAPLRVELSPGPRRSGNEGGTCVAVLKS